MTTSNQGTPDFSQFSNPFEEVSGVTEQALRWLIVFKSGFIYIQRKGPESAMDDPLKGYEERIIAMCKKIQADSSRVELLERVLKPIIDCYGVGYKATEIEEFVTAIGSLIEDARAALNGGQHEA